MQKLKTLILLLGIAVLGAGNVLIYCSYHFYYRAEKSQNAEARIQLLERAKKYYPENDLVFYELGKSYYSLGLRNLDDRTRSEVLFQKSTRNFKQSIRINPASYFSHFYYAQSLQKMSFISLSGNANFYEEFKKAASLAGENTQIFFETGLIFLSGWSDISDEDRNFTVEILNKLGLRRYPEKLYKILGVWEMNVKEYEVMRKILPEQPATYRIYAQFLGERSLSIEERKEILAQADFLSFEKAIRDRSLGDRAFFNFRYDEAIGYFTSCLDRLNQIKFYQKFVRGNQIDAVDFNSLKKNALLNLLKSIIGKKTGFKEVEAYLFSYLSLELSRAELNDLESYLKDRGFINGNLDAAFGDLDLLSLQFLLYFKQSRYDEIVRAGRRFAKNIFRIPEDKKGKFVEILGYIGDACNRINYIYDVEDYYKTALEYDPDNIEILIGMLQNYTKQNRSDKIREISRRIDQIIFSEKEGYRNITLKKGESLLSNLTLDNRSMMIDIKLKNDEVELSPLISVFFNNQIVWEEYVNEDLISIPLQSKIGDNSLEIVAVNQTISVDRISFR